MLIKIERKNKPGRLSPEAAPKISFTKGDGCPHCKFGILRIRSSRFGLFLGCDQFPSCAYTVPLGRGEELPPSMVREDPPESNESDLVFT